MRQPRNDFQQEIDEVQALIVASLQGLYSPLGELALAQVRDSQPPVRAAFVLASAVSESPAERLREKRIFLAAALELLAVALSVHHLLIAATNADRSPDRSVVGSTILAGDYCFSRAADLAAQTESPAVVEIFSRTLKAISEKGLESTGLAHGNDGTEEELLIAAGVEASARLASPGVDAIGFALEVVEWFTQHASGAAPRTPKGRVLDPVQRRRWNAALDWLVTARPS